MEAKNGCLILIIALSVFAGILMQKQVDKAKGKLIKTQQTVILRQDSIIDNYKLMLHDCMITRDEFNKMVELLNKQKK